MTAMDTVDKTETSLKKLSMVSFNESTSLTYYNCNKSYIKCKNHI